MRTIETKIFTFDELNDKAKENARCWYRSIDDFEPDYVIEDFQRVAFILGFDVHTRGVRTVGGTERQKPRIYYSLGCKGAGASFCGRYRYMVGSKKAIRDHAPNDTILHGIADDLHAIQQKARWGIEAEIREVRDNMIEIEILSNEIPHAQYLALRLTVLRFSKWLHDQLKAEYEHQSSDEYIDDMLRMNEYEFTEKGEHYR